MFRTRFDAELPNPGHVPGLRLWSTVEHGLQLPWFYVALSESLQGERQGRMLMISDTFLLGELVANQTPVSKIIEIQVVIPGWMNQEGRWLMQPIVTLTESIHNSGKWYSYRTADGQTYEEGVDQFTSFECRTVYERLPESVTTDSIVIPTPA